MQIAWISMKLSHLVCWYRVAD